MKELLEPSRQYASRLGRTDEMVPISPAWWHSSDDEASFLKVGTDFHLLGGFRFFIWLRLLLAKVLGRGRRRRLAA
jgi:hypothetical protein